MLFDHPVTSTEASAGTCGTAKPGHSFFEAAAPLSPLGRERLLKQISLPLNGPKTSHMK